MPTFQLLDESGSGELYFRPATRHARYLTLPHPGREFAPPRRRRGTTRSDHARRSPELRVGDDGAGFPPAFIAHAFERFSRANGSGPTTGAGLGLAIVAAIAHATAAAPPPPTDPTAGPR